MMARLPSPGGDDGQWGTLLNDYLSQSLTSTGSINPGVIGADQIQAGAITAAKLATNSVVDANIAAGAAIQQSKVSGLTSDLGAKYVKPGSGIPETDLATAVTNKLNAATPADGSVTTAKIAVGGIAPAAVSGTAVITSDVRLTTQLTVTAKTASYTIAATDSGTVHSINSASAVTVTIPANATAGIPVGSIIEFLRYGVGSVTVAADSGVSIGSDGGLLSIAAQYKSATILKVATDQWVLQGDLA